MKRLWTIPTLALCLTGCTMLPTAETKPPTKTTLSITEKTPKQIVTVEQINDSNAKEMSNALNAELDQAQNGLVIEPEKPATPAKAK